MILFSLIGNEFCLRGWEVGIEATFLFQRRVESFTEPVLLISPFFFLYSFIVAIIDSCLPAIPWVGVVLSYFFITAACHLEIPVH